MKLSTKNIDKAVRAIKKSIAGERITVHHYCMGCGKKVGKKWLAQINGLGWLNYYHPKCLKF